MPNTDFRIQPAAAIDIGQLLASLSGADINGWGEADFNGVMGSARGELRVASSDNELVGFIASSSVVDEVTLLNVAVAPAYRRRGLAQALIGRMLKARRSQGASRCLLEGRESNHSARRLYTALGFLIDGRRPDYYRTATGREDAVLMSLTLENNP